MNEEFKIKRLAEGQVTPTVSRATTIKILSNAQSKSVGVAADTQTPAHATPAHLLT